MPFKVLHNHFENAIGISRVRASISHRTTSTVQILPHDHWDFPNTRITLCGTRWNHTVMENLVVQSVRPAGWSVFINRHWRIISKVWVVQHFEHFVATDRQEWSAHSFDVRQFHTSISRQDLSLASNFFGPLFLWKLFTETMSIIDRCEKKVC